MRARERERDEKKPNCVSIYNLWRLMVSIISVSAKKLCVETVNLYGFMFASTIWIWSSDFLCWLLTSLFVWFNFNFSFIGYTNSLHMKNFCWLHLLFHYFISEMAWNLFFSADCVLCV